MGRPLASKTTFAKSFPSYMSGMGKMRFKMTNMIGGIKNINSAMRLTKNLSPVSVL
jgi:hypothetical protein